MTMIVNTTSSIRQAARTIDAMIEADAIAVRKDIENAAENAANRMEGIIEHVEEVIEKDASRVIHSLSASALSVGTDLVVRFDHATGEVKRIVLQGGMTVNQLIDRLKALA